MAYLNARLLPHIQGPVKTILELGSRDLEDAVRLAEHFDAHVYAFECNPDCLELCQKRVATLTPELARKVNLIPYAVSSSDGPVSFYAFDREKYDNIGASSMLKIDFSKRSQTDPDYNRPNPQKEVVVPGIRMDTFCDAYIPGRVDLLCMDLQGYELEALKSFGARLQTVDAIVTEVAFESTYTGGARFDDLRAFLESQGFVLVAHDAEYPELVAYLGSLISGSPAKHPGHTGVVFSEFNCLFKKRKDRRVMEAQIASLKAQIADLELELKGL